MDDEIQETVEAILGKGIKVVDCEKKSSIKEEEVLLINGCPVTLDGADGVAIREALLSGTIPNCDLLNQMLVRAGILKSAVKLETSLSVKSSVMSREQVIVAKASTGQVLDQRSRETKHDNHYTSSTSEIWEPLLLEKGTDGISQVAPICRYRETNIRSTSDHNPSKGEDITDFQHDSCVTDDACIGNGIHSISLKFPQEEEEDNNHESCVIHSLCGDEFISNGVNSCVENTERKSNLLKREENGLIYYGEFIYSGTLESLIDYIVKFSDDQHSDVIYRAEPSFFFSFILTSHLFIEPRKLLEQLINKFDQHSKDANKSKSLSPGFVRLIKEWFETFPYDFRNDRMVSLIRNAVNDYAKSANDISSKEELTNLLRSLVDKLTQLSEYESKVDKNENFVDSIDQLPQVSMTEVCPQPGILAEHLSFIELQYLSHIGPEEFVRAFAKGSPICRKLDGVSKSFNLKSYVTWFNRLSYVVVTEICKLPRKKLRIKVAEYWIEVARECFNLGNFNSLMAIISGLNMSPVLRLKKMWSKIQSAKFSVLEHQMDPSCNFSSYRSTLKAAIWRSAGTEDNRQKIIIPFFSLFLKDIYFMNEACAKKLPNDHINFEKCQQLAKLIFEFRNWQHTVFPFKTDPVILESLEKSPVLSEKAMALASYDCEAPENCTEKDRFKTLKSDTNQTKSSKA